MSEYDADILLWSEHQADILRRLAAGEQVNDHVDWQNVIDEVESVGRNELRAVQSHLVQALLHNLKCLAWASSQAVDHWQAEAQGHRDEAMRSYSPSMRQHLNIDKLYAEAVRRLPKTIDGLPAASVPAMCPWSLDDLLSKNP